MPNRLVCDSQTVVASFPAFGTGRALTVADAERAAVDDALAAISDLVTWVHRKVDSLECAAGCSKHLEWTHSWKFIRRGRVMDREYIDVEIDFTATVICRRKKSAPG